MDYPETSELIAFVAVVDAGSLSGGALDLGLPRATISRRLGRLEERLGVRLLHRTTRRLGLTEAGAELYEHARAIVLSVELAAQAVRPDPEVPSGLLRVSVPPVRDPVLRELLLSFVERHEQVQLEVISSTAHEDLVARNIDVAWRAGTDLDPGLVARRLLRSELLGVASPDYLQRRGAPRSAAALAEHRCLVGFSRGERPATHWPLRAGDQVRVHGGLVSNDVHLLLDAARRGLGIALLPRVLSDDAIADGALLPVLPDVLGAISEVALVYPERRLLKPTVRAFVDHVVARLPG